MPKTITSIDSFSEEEIENIQSSIFAVHVTNCKPVGFEQITGSSNLLENLHFYGIKETPIVRAKIHWCLTRVVTNIFSDESGEKVLVDNRKYAIITKLCNLSPQLINIHINDTITLGSYFLSSNDYVFVPEFTDPTPWGNANINYYDPNEKNIREVVDDFIKMQGGLIISEEQNQDVGNNKYVAEIDNQKIFYIGESDPTVFKNIILKLGISFGTDDQSIIGWFTSYLGGIQEQVLGYILEIVASDVVKFGYTIEYLQLLKGVATCIKSRVFNEVNDSSRFPERIKNQFNQQQNNFYSWLKFLDLESDLYLNHRKTLMGANKEYINYLISNIDKPLSELLYYIEEKKEDFKDCLPINYISSFNLEKIYFIGNKFLSKILIEDFEEEACLKSNPGNVLLYIIMNLSDYDIIDVEENTNLFKMRLIKLLDESFKNLLEIENTQCCNYVKGILMLSINNVIKVISDIRPGNEENTYGGADIIKFLVKNSCYFNEFFNSMFLTSIEYNQVHNYKKADTELFFSQQNNMFLQKSSNKVKILPQYYSDVVLQRNNALRASIS